MLCCKNYEDHEKAERERLNAITVDVVSPFEQQSEVEHQIQSYESRAGYSDGREAGRERIRDPNGRSRAAGELERLKR